MKHLRLVLILAFLATFVAACGGSGGPKSVPSDGVAVVGDDTITKADYNKVLDQAKHSYAAQKKPFPKPGTQQFSTLRAQVIQYLVERSEYDQKAKDFGIKVSDKEVTARLDQVKQQYFGTTTSGKKASKSQIEQRYQQQLKTQGVKDSDIRDGIRSQLVREQIYNKVTKDVKVSDKDAKKYYDDHKSQYQQPALPERRDVRHILVKKHALAVTIYKKLKGGADFSKLALKYSIDPSKTSGGRLTICKTQSTGCIKTVPSFEKAAFALKTNEISQPVKDPQYHGWWHVIQALGPVQAATKAKPTSFEQVKSAIKQQLVQQKKQEAMTSWWNDTKKSFAKKTKYQTGYAPPASATTPTTTTG